MAAVGPLKAWLSLYNTLTSRGQDAIKHDILGHRLVKMHEVLTLQFGQQANHVGTHYWNTQESYFTYAGEEDSPVDHDASFRPGIGADGAETYTPRTVIYDLKGAFGTLRRENALYELQRQENPASQGQWSGSTIPMRLPPIAPSAYQQALDAGSEPPRLTTDTVRFWSDYNHIFYHPRSIVQLNEYELNSSLMPFEQWQKGEELFANLDREHDLLDRDLRPFLEECDQLQGIQVFSSTDDAWGGFASKYLERIRDELGKGCRWVFGLQETQRVARDRQTLQLANAAQSLYALDTSASMHIPVVSLPSSLPPYVSLNGDSRWVSSALQAAAIESATLPTRLRSTQPSRATFDNLETVLNGDGKRRIAACSLTAEDTRDTGAPQVNGHAENHLTNGFSDYEEDGHSEHKPLDIDLFPPLSITTSSTSRTHSQRRSQLFSQVKTLRNPQSSEPRPCDDHSVASRRRTLGPRTATYLSSLLFPILTSYPQIFNFTHQTPKVQIQTSLSTSSDIATRVRSLEAITRRMISIDEREVLSDGLGAIADEYEEGWFSDSESEDD